MSNLKNYDNFLLESKFDFSDLEFLTADEVEKLPAYKQMDSRFAVTVFQRSPKTITFESPGRLAYGLTVSKSRKISYGTLNISPDGKFAHIDFFQSWDSIIDFLQIYVISMGSGLSISQVRSFIIGHKPPDNLIIVDLKEKKASNGESYFDILKEISIKYNGEEKINKMLSDLYKKGEGLIETFEPLINSDIFKAIQNNLITEYDLSKDGKSLMVKIKSLLRFGNPWDRETYQYFRINPVKGIKMNKNKGEYLIGVQDENIMVQSFLNRMIKKIEEELDSNQNKGEALNMVFRQSTLEILKQIQSGNLSPDKSVSYSDGIRKLYNSNDINQLYSMYHRSIFMDNSYGTEIKDLINNIFNDAFNEDQLKRIEIGAIFLANNVNIFKNS